MNKKKESKEAAELRARLWAIKVSIDKLRSSQRKIEQELAEELAEFKIGDRIYYDSKPAVVTSIGWGYIGPTYAFRRVKKNGELYAGVESEAWSERYIEPRSEPVENEETIEQREARLKI